MLRKAERRGERERRFDLKGSGRGTLGSWLVRHLQSFFFSLGLMARAPLATLLTSAVLGIALALPGGLYLLLDNVTRVTGHWDTGGRISVFLKTAQSDEDAEALALELRGWRETARVLVTTRAEALSEFRSMSGFAEVMDAFKDDNPLPAVLTVEPTAEIQNPSGMTLLLAKLSELPQVELAQFDMQWLKRLDAIIEIVLRGTYLLAALLGLGVVLIIGNTIRLGIENRREEIEIASLFGATNAFIRRPFLYGGLLYGLFGAVVAWGILAAGFALLEPAVARLAILYGGGFQLAGLSATAVFSLGGFGAGLGLLGAWVAVGRHLRNTVPE
jgi:cell division transport system permease protein